jgi:hypothetical protein
VRLLSSAPILQQPCKAETRGATPKENIVATAAERKDKPEKPAHETTIIVNGQEKTTTEKELSFEEVVSIAYDGNPPTGPNWEFTVTYRRGHGNKPEGSLIPGQSVKVKEGMIFNVRATDKS